MEFEGNVGLPKHAHGAKIGFVLEGKIESNSGVEKKCFSKKDRYYILAGVYHSGRIYAGFVDIAFFDDAIRYSRKSE